MGIIINDFEIQLDEPRKISSQRRRAQLLERPQRVQIPTLSPQDVERIVRHFDERRSRLRAD